MYGYPFSRENTAAIQEKIESIPAAMHRMGWTVSAELMERWLRSPAWRLPEAWKRHSSDHHYTHSHMDERIVRMKWALKHPRVSAKLIQLRAKMSNDVARGVLRDRISDLRWGDDNRLSFGSRHDHAVQLERSCQANWHQLGSSFDTLDDMYGSLGMATLKVALIGEAMHDKKTKRYSLRVTDAGFYIRDSYDFNGPQYLGTWKRDRVLSKGMLAINAVADGLTFNWGKSKGHLSNDDFEMYRRATGFGGDFVIYSDVHWERADLTLDLG